MDEKTRERVHQIAKSLKELHLVATMDEALDRAKQIVESAEKMGKPMKDLVSDMKEESEDLSRQAVHLQKDFDRSREELSSESKAHHVGIERDAESAESDVEGVKRACDLLEQGIKRHKLEKVDVEKASEDIDEISCAADDAGFIVKEAEKIQKKKK